MGPRGQERVTTTNEIADKIATNHGLTKVQSKAIVEAVFSAITTAAESPRLPFRASASSR